MPTGVYVRTEEYRKNMSKIMKGKPSWNKGKHISKETKQKISLKLKGCEGTWLDKKLSEDHKEKIRLSMLGKNTWSKGRKLTPAQKEKTIKNLNHNSGKENASWKGDKAGYLALHAWIKKVFGKPNVCSICGTTVAKKFEWANIDGKYRRDGINWMRLCTSCHHILDSTIRKLRKYALIIFYYDTQTFANIKSFD